MAGVRWTNTVLSQARMACISIRPGGSENGYSQYQPFMVPKSTPFVKQVSISSYWQSTVATNI